MNEITGRYQGTTLIELMISLIIVSILVIGFSQIYLKIKASYRFQQAILEAQDNGRFAAHLFREQIRGAGFIGCLKFSESMDLNFFPLRIYKAGSTTWYPNLPTQLQTKVRLATDVIQIQGVGPNLASLTRAMENNYELVVSKEQSFQVGDIVIVADCLHAYLFTIAAVTDRKDSQMLTSRSALKFRYDQFATIGKLKRDTYYIRKASWTNQSGDDIYSLYRMDVKNNHIELVPGIEAMQMSVDESQVAGSLESVVVLSLSVATVERVKSDSGNRFHSPWELIVSSR